MSNEPVVLGPVEPKPATATEFSGWEPPRRSPREKLALLAAYEWIDKNFEEIALSLVGVIMLILGILVFMLLSDWT